MSDDKMYCIHCWIEVGPPPEPARTVGRGETLLWVHKFARDPDTGAPNCGKRLTDDDVTDDPFEAKE